MGLLEWLFGKPKTEDPIIETPIRSAPVSAITAAIGGNHLQLPKGDFRFVALDVETANGWYGSICQIGLACVRTDNTIETVGTLINPKGPFDDFNVRLHGIDKHHVANAPMFRDVLRILRPFLLRQPIIQHSSFDSRAILAACDAEDLDAPDCEWLDSVRIAQRAWPELRGNGGHGLASLKTALGLTFDHHDAQEDARAAAEVVIRAERHMAMDFREILNARSARKKVQTGRVTMEGNTDGPLSGQVAVFTGALSMSREAAAAHAAQSGITVAANVTVKTTMVIVGDQDLTQLAGHSKSSKHRKAEEYAARGQSIRIIGESEFLSIIANPTEASLPGPVPEAPEPAVTKEATIQPADATEIVVMASAGILPEGIAARLAAEKGMLMMKNVTNRTTMVVVRWQELEEGSPISTRHRAARERIASGQSIRIVDDIAFQRMLAE